MPSSARASFAALWNLDLAMASVVSSSTDPRLGAIRLAWWRERLDGLDTGELPAEPRLQLVADQLLPRGVTGNELSQLEDSWLPLLEPFVWSAPQADALRLRGQILFGAGARLLRAEAARCERAGEVWSLIDGALHCSDQASREFLLSEARRLGLPRRSLGAARPLTVLTALAMTEVQVPGSGFARGMAALHHRATGRFPRWS